MTKSSAMARSVLGVLLVSLSIFGCAHYPKNMPLQRIDHEEGYRADKLIVRPGNDKSLLFIVSFSGGGTRAAAFAYGVLEELARTEILRSGGKRRLVDEIDVITAVSGGSFTAAYFGLHGDRIFEDFEERFLRRNVQDALITRILFNPYNWIRMASPAFGRSDIAAEYYDKYIFDGRTFGDMLARGISYVAINATEMTLGVRFEFSQDYFDAICSDVAHVPIARAVAASSAVPVILSAITLENHAGTCDYTLPPLAQQALREQDRSSRTYNWASNLAAVHNAADRPYLHLFDGGLADNLGVRAALNGVMRRGGITSLFAEPSFENVREVVFVVVNAETALDVDSSQRKTAPSLFAVLNSTTSVPLQRYSFETVELLRTSLQRWQQAIYEAECGAAAQAEQQTARSDECISTSFHLIEVNFSAHKDASERDYLKRLPTSFKLTDEAVTRLRAAGSLILRLDPAYQQLLQDEVWVQRRLSPIP